MNTLPQAFLDAWENREPRMIFSTVDTNGEPNSVWVLCVKLLNDHQVLIANNFFATCTCISNTFGNSSINFLQNCKSLSGKV